MSDEFCEFLAEKLSIDVAKIKALSSEFNNKGSTESKSGDGKCAHQFKTGKNKNGYCGAAESVKGSGRCKKHQLKETDAEPKEAAPVKEKKKTASSDKDKTGLENKPVADVVDKRRGELIITLNGWNNWEHKNTGFVIDRPTRAVIGKQLPNGTIGPLTSNDVQLCNLNNWKYTIAGETVTPAVASTKGSVEIASEDEAEVDSDLEDLYE